MSEEKVRENRLRRVAHRQGFRLLKSRARDPRDITFDGYQLVDLEIGGVVFGYGNASRGYAASLDEIEEWLNSTVPKSKIGSERWARETEGVPPRPSQVPPEFRKKGGRR